MEFGTVILDQGSRKGKGTWHWILFLLSFGVAQPDPLSLDIGVW
jgi:hypothetical protein